MNTTTFTATKFDTVKEAFDASNIDTRFYTKAWDDAVETADLITDHGRVKEAYLSADKEHVFFNFECPDGLEVFNKLSIHTCLHDGAFMPVTVEGDEVKIHNNLQFPKTKESRKLLASVGMMVTCIND